MNTRSFANLYERDHAVLAKFFFSDQFFKAKPKHFAQSLEIR